MPTEAHPEEQRRRTQAQSAPAALRGGGERRQALITAVMSLAALLAAGFLLWQLSPVLLVIFSAVLLAVLLDGTARLINAILPIGHLASFAVGVLLIVGLSTAIGMSAGPQITDQVVDLAQRLPQAIENFQERVGEHPLGRMLLNMAPKPAAMIPGNGDVMSRIFGIFSTTLGVFLNTLIVLIIGLYLAANPALYVRGTLLLLPPAYRRRGAEVMRELGHALRWWLVGRLASMIIVGALTGAGLWFLGMPTALALGIIAGAFSFVPMIGPILAAVPALMIALMQDALHVVSVGLVYWVAQILEGNVITPLIQQRTVALAPAMLLAAQLLVGILFGFLGFVLATPLAVVVMVLVQMLYVRDTLHSDVHVLGRH